jgi:predicted nucleic acid-binding protein
VNSTFVDTGVWFAFSVITDEHHARAVEIIASRESRLSTSWPVVWELLTLLSRKVGGRAAAAVGKELIGERWAELIELTSVDHTLSLDLIARFENLRLSAVDATSCAIVRRLNLPRVASFDEHFRIVLPERTIVGIQIP